MNQSRLPTGCLAGTLVLGLCVASSGGCSCQGRRPLLPDAGDEAVVEPDAAVVLDGGVDAGGPFDAGAETCSSCHGSWVNAAPPKDTKGNDDRALASVGAHQAHVRESIWHRTGLCEDCHLVPDRTGAPGHIDLPPAEVVFGSMAKGDGGSPGYDGTGCSNVYCHGPTLGGAAVPAPKWTGVDGYMRCGDCHGVPPPPPHVQNVTLAACGRCHPPMLSAIGFSSPERHIDGILDVDVKGGCSACHGTPQSPAPPPDLLGATSTTARGVGAHASHLAGSTWHANVLCQDCHVVPANFGDPGHLDSPPADLTFSAKATGQGTVVPSWSGTSCTNYCHGATLHGGTDTQPTWTSVDGGQVTCHGCHGFPPTGLHPQSTQCTMCHGQVIAPDGGFLDPSLHIDGKFQASMTCGSCHGVPPPTGSHPTHAGLAAPTYGGTETADALSSPTGYAYGCGFCHPLDPAKHMSGGRADIELYAPPPIAGPKGMSPDAGYTPGGAQYLDSFGKPYTLGTCRNVYCHSGPTYATPGGVPDPLPFTGYPLSYPPYTVVRGRSYASPTWGGAGTSCGGCHGFPIRTYWPTVLATVGSTHSYIDSANDESGHGWNHGRPPLACRTCHYKTVNLVGGVSRDAGISVYDDLPITGFGKHANGVADVDFDRVDAIPYPSLLPNTFLTQAAWDGPTRTCSNVACHWDQTQVQDGTPYRYQNGLECNNCHQY